MATAQYITLRMPLTLRLRLAAPRLLAAAGLDSGNRAESERRLMEITRDQGNLIAGL